MRVCYPYSRGRAVALILVALLVFERTAQATTLAELRQGVVDAQPEISTARFVCTQESIHFTPSDKGAGSASKPHGLDRHSLRHVTSIVDMNLARQKVVKKDLRTASMLAKAEASPGGQRIKTDQNRTDVRQDGLQLTYFGREGGGTKKPFLYLRELSKTVGNESWRFETGLLSTRYLAEEGNPSVKDVSIDGRDSVILTLSEKKQGKHYQATIEIDPALGYRFTRRRHTVDGVLRMDVQADDYRDVNGIPYPHKFTVYTYDQFGNPREEKKWVYTNIQFGLDFAAEDFRVTVSKGTDVQNLVDKSFAKIPSGGSFGIWDIVNIKLGAN